MTKSEEIRALKKENERLRNQLMPGRRIKDAVSKQADDPVASRGLRQSIDAACSLFLLRRGLLSKGRLPWRVRFERRVP
jgi:hypothetical protein